MAAKTLTIDGKQISADENASILDAATEAGITIPTLCHLEGVYDVGACRLCLVEVTGISKLLPACTTKVSEGMDIQTNTERLRKYRRMTLELLFAERNHVCAVCVANGHCELQTLAYSQGMDHDRYEYCFPKWEVDNTHPLFGMDHNRCILCSRCVRVCWHIEGAGTKNVSGRGGRSRWPHLRRGWQHQRLFKGTIEVIGEVHGILIKVSQQFLGHFVEARFGITHGSRGIPIHRAEVTLPIHQQVAH